MNQGGFTFECRGILKGKFSFMDEETKEPVHIGQVIWMGGIKNFPLPKDLYDQLPEEGSEITVCGELEITSKGSVKLKALAVSEGVAETTGPATSRRTARAPAA